MIWQVWYANGAVYNGTTVDEWKALPEDGVVFVEVIRDTGRTIIDGGDWYYWVNDEILFVPSVEWGVEQPKPVGCSSCIKRGVGLSDEEFERMRQEVWHGR